MPKKNIKDYSPQELEQIIVGMGEPAYKARQLSEWVFHKGVTSFHDMSDIPIALRRQLSKEFHLGVLLLLKKQVSKQGDAKKYLLGLRDGNAIETVLLQYSYGYSVCISTQAGCRMGCRFCASATGLARHLTCGEMYDQVLVARREVKKKLNHVVLMGTGEPLDNLEQVLKFIGQITGPHSLRFSMRHITISTCGLIPGIQALMEHKLPITLAVSLHAPDDALRSQLMPVNQKYPLAQLLEVCALYATFTGRRITFEYALLAGINDKVQQAEQLASLLQGMLCHVNLISYNSVVGKGYHPTAPDKVELFRKTLEDRGIRVTVRRKMGFDIDAACGQLRRTYVSPNKD